MFTPDKNRKNEVNFSRKKSSGNYSLFPAFQVRTVRISIFLLLIFWCAGFSVLSFFPGNVTAVILYPFLNKIYSSFCHQDHEKTIHLTQYFLVCARCSGIYCGAAAAALVSVFFLINRRFHFSLKTGLFFMLPMIFDLIFYNSGLYSYSLTAAFSTGLVFGSALIAFILSILENNFFRNSRGLS